MRRAADWLLAREVRRKGDWSVKRPHTEPSGWAFEYRNEFYPDVDDTARAVAEHLGSSFAEAEGVALGNAKLRAGSAVSVGQVADTFSGKYTLTRTRHVFDNDGYRTEFEISGMQDRSTLGLVSLGATNGAVSAGGPPVSVQRRIRRPSAICDHLTSI